MPYFVYILECSDKTYYVGCTNNLEKRIREHNRAKAGAHYTKIRRPIKLMYSEKFKTLLEARRREAEIKRWRRKQKESLWSKLLAIFWRLLGWWPDWRGMMPSKAQ